MTYGLIGRFIAHPGRAGELIDVLLAAASQLEGNPDCLQYLVATAPDDANGVWVTEVWTDSAAHQAALEPEAVRAVIARARPLIAGMTDRTELDVLGGKRA